MEVGENAPVQIEIEGVEAGNFEVKTEDGETVVIKL